MKKLKKIEIDFKDFEIIKVGLREIRGGSGSRAATPDDAAHLGQVLPSACDHAG